MNKYRPNVAALMVNERGQLLVCERFKVPGAWQFPQGGVDKGEENDAALLREVQEEIGYSPEHYEVVKKQDGYRYDYPEGFKKGKKGKYIGQEQTYYLCQVKEGAPEVNVMQEPREFSQYRWIWPEEFSLDWLPAFKLEVYRSVMRDFFEVTI